MPEPPGFVVKKGTNKLPGLDNAWPVVTYPNFDLPIVARPPDFDSSTGFERRVDTVAQHVDEQLLELIAVGLDHQSRGRDKAPA